MESIRLELYLRTSGPQGNEMYFLESYLIIYEYWMSLLLIMDYFIVYDCVVRVENSFIESIYSLPFSTFQIPPKPKRKPRRVVP